MPTVKFYHGSASMIDYTAGGTKVDAGDVIVENDGVYIAHTEIPANTLGAVAAGGGNYIVPKLSALELERGEIVYWDADNDRVVRDASKPLFGKVNEAAGDGEESVKVSHINFTNT